MCLSGRASPQALYRAFPRERENRLTPLRLLSTAQTLRWFARWVSGILVWQSHQRSASCGRTIQKFRCMGSANLGGSKGGRARPLFVVLIRGFQGEEIEIFPRPGGVGNIRFCRMAAKLPASPKPLHVRDRGAAAQADFVSGKTPEQWDSCMQRFLRRVLSRAARPQTAFWFLFGRAKRNAHPQMRNLLCTPLPNEESENRGRIA